MRRQDAGIEQANRISSAVQAGLQGYPAAAVCAGLSAIDCYWRNLVSFPTGRYQAVPALWRRGADADIASLPFVDYKGTEMFSAPPDAGEYTWKGNGRHKDGPRELPQASAVSEVRQLGLAQQRP